MIFHNFSLFFATWCATNEASLTRLEASQAEWLCFTHPGSSMFQWVHVLINKQTTGWGKTVLLRRLSKLSNLPKATQPVNMHVSRQAGQQWNEDISLGFPYSEIHTLLVTSVYGSHSFLFLFQRKAAWCCSVCLKKYSKWKRFHSKKLNLWSKCLENIYFSPLSPVSVSCAYYTFKAIEVLP